MKAGSPPVVDDDTKVIFDNVSHIFLELMTFVVHYLLKDLTINEKTYMVFHMITKSI